MNRKQIPLRSRRSLVIVLVLLGIALSSACGTSAPTRYYLLTAIPSGDQSMGDHADPRIGVGPIEFPEYLHRQQIVSRQSPNELQVAGLDQWAEPLQKNFSRVLGENLGMLLGTEAVFLFPWKFYSAVDYQVVMSINRFEPGVDNVFILQASWTILQDRQSRVIRKSSVSIPLESQGYAAHAAAASQAVAKLSHQIADEITALLNQKP